MSLLAAWDTSESLSKAPVKGNMAHTHPEPRYEYAIQYERLLHPGEWITHWPLGEVSIKDATLEFVFRPQHYGFNYRLVRRPINTDWEVVLDGNPDT